MSRMTRAKIQAASSARRTVGNLIARRLEADSRIDTDDGFTVALRLPPPRVARDSRDAERLAVSVDPGDVPPDRWIYEPPPLTREPIWIGVAENAVLAGKCPVGITKTGKLIRDTIFRHPERINPALATTVDVPSLSCLLGLPSATVDRLPHACLLTSRWNNYGHWITEHLPKLRALDAYASAVGEMPQIVLESGAPSWKLELLRSYGIDRDGVHTWSGSGPVAVDRLVVPRYPQPDYESLGWVRDTVLTDRARVDRRLYIARPPNRSRGVVNEQDIAPVLRRYGIDLVRPEKHSPIEQANLFAAASLIVGPNGSGFTNGIYSASATWVEIYGHRVHFGFRQIAIAMGHSHVPMYCAPSDRLVVDPDHLDRLLSRVG